MVLNLQPTLENDLVKIRPLQTEDFEALYTVAKDPLIWEQHPVKNRWRLDVYKSFFEESMLSGGALIVEDVQGTCIGSSRFKEIPQMTTAIEIGWSFLSRANWGGLYNKAVKSLMIEHAFTCLKTVVFYIGKDNIRSQCACEKLGAHRVSINQWSDIVKNPDSDYTYIIQKTD